MMPERSNYQKAADVLDEAWDAITEPPGQALEPEGERVPWATAALGVAIGYALLALCDELRARS
jgi:hypothetical protein